MKQVWQELATKEFLSVETLQHLHENYPQMMKEWRDYTGLDVRTMKQLAEAEALPYSWLELFFTKEPSDTLSFKLSVVLALTKIVGTEALEIMTDWLNEDIKRNWK